MDLFVEPTSFHFNKLIEKQSIYYSLNSRSIEFNNVRFITDFVFLRIIREAYGDGDIVRSLAGVEWSDLIAV